MNNEYEVTLKDLKFTIQCKDDEIDKILELIGWDNFVYCEQL